MDIRLNIGMRCGRRQNDAAYQRHRRRSVTGRHAIIIHRRHMEHQRSRRHVPNALDCKAAAESSSDRASFPVKGASTHEEGFYVQRDVLRATGTQRVPPVASTSSHAFSPKFGLSESKFGLKAFS
jgi:hypothetical protein